MSALSLSPLQGRNTQSTNRRFVRGVYFALKRRGLRVIFRKENGLSFHSADIIGLQKISSLIDRQKPFQRVPADNGLAPHFEDGQLSPFHQLTHGVPADTRTFCGFLYGKSYFDCTHSINLLFRILILQLLFYHYTCSAISCQPILQPFIVYLQLLLK